MTDKHVPSTAGGGPRDFSAAVHSNVTGRGVLIIGARVHLPDSEIVAEIDVFNALQELLERNDLGRCRLEVWREGGNGAVLTNGRTG